MKEKSLAKNSVYYLIYQVLNVVFPFITGMYVARILLPDSVGKVSYAQNIASYFAIFAFLGIPTYGLREVSKARNDKNKLSKVYSELMMINTISTAVFSLLYAITIVSVASYRNNFLLYIICGFSVILNFLNNTWLFEGLEEFKYISVRNIIFKAVCLVLLFLFIKDQNDYILYAAITVLGTAGNYLLNVLYSRRFVRFSARSLDIKRHLKPVFTLVVVNLAIELYSLVDVTMLGMFSADKNVAFYTYAQRIFRILLQVINAFTIVVVPRLAMYYKNKQKEEFNSTTSKTIEIIFILAFPIIAGIQIVGPDAVKLIYGDAFAAAANTLRILSLILIVSPIGYLLGSRMLLITGHENLMIYCVGLGAIVNVIGNLILIPRFAETGAAITSLFSEICVMAIYVWFGRKYYKLQKMYSDIIKTMISTVVMGLVIFVLGRMINGLMVKVLIQVFVGVFSYFGLQYVQKESVVRTYGNMLLNKVVKKASTICNI